MSDDQLQPEMDDRSLDTLLGQARWPAPTRGSEERLRRFWFSLGRSSPLPRLALAASVLLAAGIGLMVYRSSEHRPQAHVPNYPISPRAVPVASGEYVFFRPPTRLEMAMFNTVEKEAKAPGAHAASRPLRDRVNLALELLIRDQSEQGLARAIASIGPIDHGRFESELAGQIHGGNPGRRQSAARLLTAIATANSIPSLMELDADPQMRGLAVAALARVAPPEMLVSLVHTHSEPAQAKTLAAALLRDSSEPRIRVFLELVEDSQTRAVVLKALDVIPRPPTEAFFAALQDPHVSIRNAAARVLGRIDGPQTTDRLIAMVTENQSRREALLALADSRGPEARRFVETARIGGPLAGAVRSILIEQLTDE